MYECKFSSAGKMFKFWSRANKLYFLLRLSFVCGESKVVVLNDSSHAEESLGTRLNKLLRLLCLLMVMCYPDTPVPAYGNGLP